MKTITEFPALNIKNAAKIRKDLVASGKSSEELLQALGEALKLEGDKLNFILNALDAAGDRLEDLKRVIVFTLNEGEKAPDRAQQKADHYYVVEHYAPLHPRGGSGRNDRDGKPGDRHEGRGGKGGKDKRGAKGGRGDRNKGRDDKRGERRPPRPPVNPLPAGAPKPPPVVLASKSAPAPKSET